MSEASVEEEILVLYASQTGNSEQAAKDICDQIPVRLSPARIHKLTNSSKSILIKARHLQLDDFLEVEHAPWTRIVIVCLSSYGVGQAPLGGYRFRDLCDAILEEQQQQQQQQQPKKESKLLLKGLTFALLGLGDSMYTTFFENPTTTNEALQKAGAKRVGALGKADASGDQLKAVAEWIDGIWPALAAALVDDKDAPSVERLKEMQDDTMELCYKINPDLTPPTSTTSGSSNTIMLIFSLLVAILAVATYYYTQ